jgi:hypothetical protein
VTEVDERKRDEQGTDGRRYAGSEPLRVERARARSLSTVVDIRLSTSAAGASRLRPAAGAMES